jgi:hypothetical protein
LYVKISLSSIPLLSHAVCLAGKTPARYPVFKGTETLLEDQPGRIKRASATAAYFQLAFLITFKQIV